MWLTLVQSPTCHMVPKHVKNSKTLLGIAPNFPPTICRYRLTFFFFFHSLLGGRGASKLKPLMPDKCSPTGLISVPKWRFLLFNHLTYILLLIHLYQSLVKFLIHNFFQCSLYSRLFRWNMLEMHYCNTLGHQSLNIIWEKGFRFFSSLD